MALQRKFVSAPLLSLFLVASCSTEHSSTEQTSAAESSVALSLPPQIASAKNVNPINMGLELFVDGSLIENVVKGEDIWRATVVVPPGQSIPISAYWYENFQQTRRLNLAKWEDTMVFNSNADISIGLSQFTTTGDEFDADGDSASNLDERNARSNPFDQLSTPQTIPLADVILPVIPATSASRPIIDGIYEQDKYEAQNAQFSDTRGNLLAIDNLMITDSVSVPRPGRGDGNTEMRWFAMHDRSFLYIFVLGETVDLSSPNGDSVDFLWNDDNLNIFLDPNNSKLDTYDGVDDIRIEIPLLDSNGQANNSTNPQSRIVVASALPSGETTTPPSSPNIEFAVCVCNSGDQHTWEIKIPMDQVGLTPRARFGIDVQIDLDHDGNDRDVRWGWFHPSGFDSTWIRPAAMGTGFLQ